VKLPLLRLFTNAGDNGGGCLMAALTPAAEQCHHADFLFFGLFHRRTSFNETLCCSKKSRETIWG